ncbi:hypothetical protein [Escherichia coli]|uniref:phage terminase large subunit family protein n=1 Tax=Escherichia coli TaxID=562 RepID=UPI00073C7662
MCEFVDDKASVFPFEELQRCMVDTLEEWEDYAPFAANPFGSRPVWIGYDPSHRGDSAGCVVLAPPVVAGGKFRILERHQWKGMDFATQAESIRKLTENITSKYIGIDATGLVSACSSSCARSILRARYPLHAGNENRNGAQGKRRYPPWLSGI